MSRRVSQVQVSLIYVDEFDALAQEGPFPFSGDKDASAVQKAQHFLAHLTEEPQAESEDD